MSSEKYLFPVLYLQPFEIINIVCHTVAHCCRLNVAPLDRNVEYYSFFK
jgi:hypothetical protein